MYCVGIDIGSTASKLVVMDKDKEEILAHKVQPSGWNMRETSAAIEDWLKQENYYEGSCIVATGYGRISVPYADRKSVV